ncbi:hemagglutinin repeat-containing protein [Pseudomonas aeruginosa]|uniref:hemagglutinin repeat-containing protein n=1 Tax=Pseudomonas aeruginosa TaxID=287 RepID=UPI003B522FC3
MSLTALTGDVINERSVTRYDSALDGRTWERSFADSAARWRRQQLNVQAGRDIANLGGVLQSRGDLSLDAGRDVTVAAVEDRQGQTRWNTSRLQSVTQLGAEVSAGRDLNNQRRARPQRGRALEARRDIALSRARRDPGGGGERRSMPTARPGRSPTRKTRSPSKAPAWMPGRPGDQCRTGPAPDREPGQRRRRGLPGGRRQAGTAGRQRQQLLPVRQEEERRLRPQKTRRDEVTDVKAVGSQISSGGDLTLLSGGDQTYQGAKLESGNDLAIVSGGAVTFGR